MTTGWDNGLCQDYCRGLSLWFSSRLDARHTIRKHLMTQPNTQAPEWAEDCARILLKLKDALAERGGRPLSGEKAELWDEACAMYERMLAWSLASQPAQAETVVPEFNGWYCAQCQCGVDGRDVTYHEQHTACGRVITNDRPPTPPQAQPAPVVSAGNVVQDAYRTLYGDRWQEPAPVAVDEQSTLLKRVTAINSSFEAWSRDTNQGYELTREDGQYLATYHDIKTEHAWRGYCAAALLSARSGQASSPARLICDSCGHRGVESEFLSAGTYICPACGDADVSEDGGDAGGEAAGRDLLDALRMARDALDSIPRSLGYDFTHLPQIDAVLAQYTTPPAAVSAEGVDSRRAEVAAVLRAMAHNNYSNGHAWDYLDAKVCNEAADLLAAPVQAGQGVGVDIKRLVAFAKLFFSHGFHRPQTYNDTVLNSPEEAWAEDKFDDAYIKRRWGEAALAASKEGQSHE